MIVTLGVKGTLLADPKQSQWIPAYAVEARDTTAAGDAFNGGLAVGLGSGLAVPDAVRLASCAGALAATRLGAQPSLPTKQELDEFCRSRGLAF